MMKTQLPFSQSLLIALASLFLFIAASTLHAQGKNTSSGFLDFNAYPYLSDVDNDSVFTLNIAANLPNRISYFSLLNLFNQSNADELEDSDGYYTEQNIRWKISENSPLDLTLQMNFRTGEENDRHRLGVRWRLNDSAFLKAYFEAMNLRYAINLHAYQYDHETPHIWQLEHSFLLKFPYLSSRLYLAGFADHIFNQDLPGNIPSNPIVTEAQLGYRLVDNLFIVSEYRLNQYRRSDVNNLALGLQYKMIW